MTQTTRFVLTSDKVDSNVGVHVVVGLAHARPDGVGVVHGVVPEGLQRLVVEHRLRTQQLRRVDQGDVFFLLEKCRKLVDYQ